VPDGRFQSCLGICHGQFARFLWWSSNSGKGDDDDKKSDKKDPSTKDKKPEEESKEKVEPDLIEDVDVSMGEKRVRVYAASAGPLFAAAPQIHLMLVRFIVPGYCEIRFRLGGTGKER
jgi:hypothetical protein